MCVSMIHLMGVFLFLLTVGLLKSLGMMSSSLFSIMSNNKDGDVMTTVSRENNIRNEHISDSDDHSAGLSSFQ